MKSIFFGTPQFAVTILKVLIEAGYTPALVVTAPDKPKGRSHTLTPPPIKIRAEEYTIPVLQPITLKNREIANTIAAARPDLFIVAAYGKIIPKAILEIPKKGGINVHPSLLPTYRGPSPIQAAILNGDKTTGVTIMLMDEEMDHGKILAQAEFNIQCFASTTTNLCNQRAPTKHNDGFHATLNVEFCSTAEELSEKLAGLGAKLLIETIPKFLGGKIAPQEQNHSKATYTKIIAKEDGRIDWHKSAEEIERMVRAYTPWPSAWTKMRDTKNYAKKDMRVKILKSHIFKDDDNKKSKGSSSAIAKRDPLMRLLGPSAIIKQNSDLLVACGSGFLIVEKLQVEGKTPINGKEFFNAYPLAYLVSSDLPSQDMR